MAEIVANKGCWIAIACRARFSAPEMACELHISLRQLERAFLQSIGLSPQQWLNHARLWHACSLLLEGLSPKQLYDDLGFDTASGFFHAFKHYHECTTRDYLLNHIERASRGFVRLKQNKHICAVLDISNPQLPQLAALKALNEVLSRSERFRLYYLRASRRPKTLDVVT